MNDSNQLNAALRYIGTSLGTLFTIFGGMQFITPDQVVQLLGAVHDFNESILSAYGALTKMWIILGPIGVVILARVGVKSSSVQAMSQKLLSVASGGNKDAKNTLIAATIALPQVQTIVTDEETALASPSPSVVSKKAE